MLSVNHISIKLDGTNAKKIESNLVVHQKGNFGLNYVTTVTKDSIQASSSWGNELKHGVHTHIILKRGCVCVCECVCVCVCLYAEERNYKQEKPLSLEYRIWKRNFLYFMRSYSFLFWIFATDMDYFCHGKKK